MEPMDTDESTNVLSVADNLVGNPSASKSLSVSDHPDVAPGAHDGPGEMDELHGGDAARDVGRGDVRSTTDDVPSDSPGSVDMEDAQVA